MAPFLSLRWRHNRSDSVSNHQPNHCLLNRSFRRRSKKTSKLRVTGLCVGNSPVTGEFPAQMASNAENVSNWWRHHGESKQNHVLDTEGWVLYKHDWIQTIALTNCIIHNGWNRLHNMQSILMLFNYRRNWEYTGTRFSRYSGLSFLNHGSWHCKA